MHLDSNYDRQDRRKVWQDRRINPDRRNTVRLQSTEFDCRGRIPRRESDRDFDVSEDDLLFYPEQE